MSNISIPLQKAVEVLNEAFQADPGAIERLLAARVSCNELLADHPTIQVRAYDEEGNKIPPTLGLLGIINGLSEDPNIVIAAVYDGPANQNLQGFVILEG